MIATSCISTVKRSRDKEKSGVAKVPALFFENDAEVVVLHAQHEMIWRVFPVARCILRASVMCSRVLLGKLKRPDRKDNAVKLGSAYIGTTMILADGSEDTIIGYEDMTQEYYSENRWWTQDGKEIEGDADKDVLAVKSVLAWRVLFAGYGRTEGTYEARRILVSNQHLACSVAESYNSRTADHQPNGAGSFVHAGAEGVVLQGSPTLVFQDELAQDILNSDEIFDLRWVWAQRAKEKAAATPEITP